MRLFLTVEAKVNPTRARNFVVLESTDFLEEDSPTTLGIGAELGEGILRNERVHQPFAEDFAHLFLLQKLDHAELVQHGEAI